MFMNLSFVYTVLYSTFGVSATAFICSLYITLSLFPMFHSVGDTVVNLSIRFCGACIELPSQRYKV